MRPLGCEALLKAFYSPVFELSLPTHHRFPMSKYRLLRDRVRESATSWGIDLVAAESVSREQLLRAHDPQYVDRVLRGELTKIEVRRIGFPWSTKLVERSLRSAGATLQATRAALTDGVAVNLAGGTHHAGRARGQGFCVFNDVAIAMKVLQASNAARRFVVIDCDVHQGNGTAEIFEGDETVFTISLHGDHNFPFAKFPGDVDVPLADHTTDADYLAELQRALESSPLRDVECAMYLAGADPYVGDRLGRLSLSKQGLACRDEMVLDTCLAAKLPVCVMMAGGYARQIRDIVDIHATTVKIAATRAGRLVIQH